MSSEALTTRSGQPIHPIGIGTWGVGGAWEAEYGHEAEAVVGIHYSVAHGQNHIDTGEIYGAGHTEEIVGQALHGLNREDLFVTDKVWETHVATGQVRPAVMQMLQKLGTDYLDVLYIHKPWEDFPWLEAVPQINELINEGIVRFIGGSNFTVDHLRQAAEVSEHPIRVNQLHHNVGFREDVPPEMTTYCAENNIQIVAYKPLERGKLFEDETVQAIAKAHQATPAQVALAWLLQQDMLTITQATDKAFIDQNIAATSVVLTAEEVARLDHVA